MCFLNERYCTAHRILLSLTCIHTRAWERRDSMAPTEWQQYEEPTGPFTLRMPPTWQSQRTTARFHVRWLDKTQPGIAVELVGVMVGPPPLNIQHLSVTVNTEVSSHRQGQLDATPPHNTTLGTRPAWHEGHESEVDTPAIHFTLTYRLPGTWGSARHPGTVPPSLLEMQLPPMEELEERRALAERVIATFVPGLRTTGQALT
jgi:hypothetical protein